MNETNALRLAKWLDAMPSSGYALTNQAAAELRRLHEANQKLQQQLGEAVWNYGEKVRVNQELLETLKLALEALNRNDYLGWQTNIHVRQAIRAAIAKATGKQA